MKRWKSTTASGTASGSGGGDNDKEDSQDGEDTVEISDDDIDLADVFSGPSSDDDESEDLDGEWWSSRNRYLDDLTCDF